MTGVLKKMKTYFARRKQRLHSIGRIGKQTFIHELATFNFRKKINIGDHCRIGRECHLDGEAGVEIGSGTILAPRVIILSSSHNYEQTNYLPYDNQDKLLPVKVGQGCWIGWGAFILPGVEIGHGAIVAMGSVVTKNVGKGEIVGGNPAKVLKIRGNIELIDELVASEKYFLKHKTLDNLKRKSRE